MINTINYEPAELKLLEGLKYQEVRAVVDKFCGLFCEAQSLDELEPLLDQAKAALAEISNDENRDEISEIQQIIVSVNVRAAVEITMKGIASKPSDKTISENA